MLNVTNTSGWSSVIEGYGISPGGTGGSTYHVTHLGDAGAGSLRDGVVNRSGPRTIVFDVAGEITLLSAMSVQQPFLTIDGSTAPTPGITLRIINANANFGVGGTHDIVIRHLRFRGPGAGTMPPADKALLLVNGNSTPDYTAHHVVLDHLTIDGATGGAIDFFGNVCDVTVSGCFIYDCAFPTDINNDTNPSVQRRRFSIHHNVYARNGERNPQLKPGTTDFNYVNNVIYEYQGYGMRIRNAPGASCSANVINNYFAAGTLTYPANMLVYGSASGQDAEEGGPGPVPQGTLVTTSAMGPLYVAGNALPFHNSDQYSTIAAPLPVPIPAKITTFATADLSTQLMPVVGTLYRTVMEQSLLDSIELAMGSASTPVADLDADDDIDVDDVWILGACRTRHGVTTTSGCLRADMDGDLDVDQEDFGQLQRCVGWAGGTSPLPIMCQMRPGPQQAPPPIPTADYYVATNGNDSWSGRLAAPSGTDGPFRTLQRAANVVMAGGVCIVRGGVYNEAVVMTRSGAALSPITFKAAAGESVALDGQGTRDYGLTIHNAGWIVLEGLTIRNYRQDGIWILDFSDHNTIRNCTVHNCNGMGIHIRGGDDCLVEYNEVFDNTCGIFIAWRDSNQNYPYRNRIRYNLAHHQGPLDPESGDGIAADSSVNGFFEYNVCWNNRDDGMDVSVRSMNNTIAGNIALLNGYPETADGDGNGIKVSTNGGGGHVLHHNFALLNRRSGFDQDIQAGVPRNYYYNNTAYGNGQSGLMLDSGGRGDAGNSAVVKNNLLAANDVLGIGRPDLYACCTSPLQVSDYNFIADGQMTYTGSVQEGPHSRSGNPLLVNPITAITTSGTGDIAARLAAIWSQVTANFATLPGSACIGAGVAVPGITQKPIPNIGAVE